VISYVCFGEDLIIAEVNDLGNACVCLALRAGSPHRAALARERSRTLQ
jgi:hypothetical protein